ncbi:MAG: hypothetical protein HKN93_06925 [Acidimicrobiia bacterium]|nr:hypothetical protein [Acidimicrobiia bacterium]
MTLLKDREKLLEATRTTTEVEPRPLVIEPLRSPVRWIQWMAVLVMAAVVAVGAVWFAQRGGEDAASEMAASYVVTEDCSYFVPGTGCVWGQQLNQIDMVPSFVSTPDCAYFVPGTGCVSGSHPIAMPSGITSTATCEYFVPGTGCVWGSGQVMTPSFVSTDSCAYFVPGTGCVWDA